jgi:DNA-binding NtrC family response regulator
VSVHPLDTLLVCRSAAIEQLRATALRVAASDARVVVTGESGTGKDVLAHFLHARSRRAHRPFVAVSAIGLAERALGAQLFGPASRRRLSSSRPAILEARGGTLFLDDVAELPMALQGRLLRLVDGGIAPPGGQPPDVRVIASTPRDLAEAVAAGRFREDLMFRLQVVRLHVPPLRERPEDVRPLVEWKARRLGRPFSCTAEVWSALEHYYWPGNVRELSNVIEQLIWTAPYPTIRLEDLPESVRGYAGAGLVPVRDRRRQVADEIYTGLVEGRYGFWTDVYEMFLRRDLTRADLRGAIRRGLTATRGSYRAMLALFGLPPGDYKRLLNFLAAHECALDFRPFRGVRGETGAGPDAGPLEPPAAGPEPAGGRAGGGSL